MQGVNLSSRHDSARKAAPDSPKPAKIVSADRDMGTALRSVYQKTVDENIPADLLDLLGKLD